MLNNSVVSVNLKLSSNDDVKTTVGSGYEQSKKKTWAIRRSSLCAVLVLEQLEALSSQSEQDYTYNTKNAIGEQYCAEKSRPDRKSCKNCIFN